MSQSVNDPGAAGAVAVPDVARDEAYARARCANCQAPLHGGYCHRCGQSVHNPIPHARHAVEERFESLWHLDSRVFHSCVFHSRVFQTLRDLLLPARVACGYLAGHRARYIAPLRLFVVLSLSTFLVGRMTVDLGGAVQLDGDDRSIATAASVEVERRRDAALEVLARAPQTDGATPVAEAALEFAQARVRSQADARIAQLQRGTATPTGTGADDVPGPTLTFAGGAPWNEHTNPFTVRWLPGVANAWINHKTGRALANAPRLQHDEALRKQVLLGAVPTASFVLMPIFALLPKFAYIRSGRLYLEHVVVALYSHASLRLALLAILVLLGIENAVAAHAPVAARVFSWPEVALWWAMPAYLLIMQKRVYGQRWSVTLLKYGVPGSAYLMLVTFAALIAGLAGLARL